MTETSLLLLTLKDGANRPQTMNVVDSSSCDGLDLRDNKEMVGIVGPTASRN